MSWCLEHRISPGEVEDSHQFPADALGLFESLGEEDDLCYLVVVGTRHGNRSEQLLQIVGQFLSASVSLPGWVHGDEYPRVGIQVHLQQRQQY